MKRFTRCRWMKTISVAASLWLAITGSASPRATVDELLDRPIGSEAPDFSLVLTATALVDDQHLMAPRSREVRAQRIIVSTADQVPMSLKWLRFAVDGVAVKLVGAVSLPYELTLDFGPLGVGSHRVEIEGFTDSGRLGYGSVVVSV